jgi:hypothetical protein
MAKTKDPKRVKAGKKAKTKGNNFEREVALAFETAYGDITRPLIQREFRRTPVSGGFRQDYPGDLIVPPWFPFMPECKHSTRVRPSASWFNLIEEGRNNWLIEVFLSERLKAVVIEKSIMVIFKDQSKPLCMVSTEMLEKLHPTLASGLMHPTIRVRVPALDVTVLSLATFCEEVTTSQLKALDAAQKKASSTDRHRAAN